MKEKCNETVIIYFDDTDRKVDAIKHASELRLDPSCVTSYPLGDKHIYGIAAECSPEFSRNYKKEYVNKRANEDKAINRSQRCNLPGERTHLKKCPEHNSCKCCPNRDNKPISISIEHSREIYGNDFFGAFDEMPVQQKIEIRETIEEAYRREPKKLEAFILDNYGYTNQEIQKTLNISERTVRRYIATATELIREIWFANI